MWRSVKRNGQTGFLAFFAAVCVALVLFFYDPAFSSANTSITEADRTAIQSIREDIAELEHLEVFRVIERMEADIERAPDAASFDDYRMLLEYAYWVDDVDRIRRYADDLRALSPAGERAATERMVQMLFGYALIVEGDYSQGIPAIETALAGALEFGETYNIGLGYSLLGAATSYFENYFEGLQYIEEARQYIPDGPEGDRLRISIYLTLAFIHVDRDEVAPMLDYYRRIIDISRARGWGFDVASIVYNTAFVLADLGEQELSREIYNDLAGMYQRLGYDDQMFYVHYGLAASFADQKMYQESFDTAEQAFATGVDDETFLTSLYQIQAVNAAWLGKLEEARDCLQKARVFFDTYPDYTETSWAKRNLRAEAAIAYAEGRYEDAMHLYEDFVRQTAEAQTNSFSNDVAGLRARLESSMESERQRAEFASQISALKIEEQERLSLFAGVVLLIVLVALFVQMRAKRQLNISMKEVERASRAKSDFLAQMSHELRTPLNAIIGFSEMMKNNVFGKMENARYEEYTSLINQSGRHLLRIINDILDISKVEAGRVDLEETWFSLCDLIAETIHILENRAGRHNIKLVHEAACDDLELFADRRVVQQILFNIITNAIKFSSPDSSVIVRCSVQANGGMGVEVQDHGIGMTKEELAEALQPFGQVQKVLTRNHEGTGLGLPLVKAFMELHEGALLFDTAPENGTKVTLSFPAERTDTAKSLGGE